MTRPTDAELAALVALGEKATPGPWVDDGWDVYYEGQEWQRCVLYLADGEPKNLVVVANCPSECYGSSLDIPEDNLAALNAKFIAAARTALPALAAEVLSFRHQAECPHDSATGIDQDDGPRKVWRCDECGYLFRGIDGADGFNYMVPAKEPPR